MRFDTECDLIFWLVWTSLAITLKMADQGRSDFYVVFTMSLSAL